MPATSSELHRAAREWAELGFAIFPIHPNSKHPATDHGFKDATTDARQIDAWWGEENPNYNIGTSPGHSGMAVLDTDPPLGEQTLLELELEHGALPDTYKVKTPRGGFHRWFKGEIPSSTSKLGPKVDTRGVGGYVLLPPSKIGDTEYETVRDIDFAQLPEWIVSSFSKSITQTTATDTLDLPVNVDRARSVLAEAIRSGDIAIEGSGGDNRTVQQIFELRDLGVSEDTALRLLSEDGGWNDHNLPPWELEELATKVHNGYAYAQNEAGAYALQPASEAFASYLSTQKAKAPTVFFRAYTAREQLEWPKPTWFIPEVLPQAGTAMLLGASRSYKTFLALDLALSIAHGIPSLLGPVAKAQETLYIAGESPYNVSYSRRPAWFIAHGLEPLDDPMRLMRNLPTILNTGVAGLIQDLHTQKLKPKFIVLDTMGKAMAGLNENDARDASIFLNGMERLRDEFDATVLLVHHLGKDAAKGARGSSAFYAGVDTVLNMEGTKATVTARVTVDKQKDAEERELPWFFQGRKIGTGMILQPISGQEYGTINAANDPFDRHKVGAALIKLAAFNRDKGVTTHVLVTEMLPASDLPMADRNVEVKHMTDKLNRLRKDKLAAYGDGDGQGWRWWIPYEKGSEA